MSRALGSAVIMGGSIAGLLAARVLSRHFDKVTLIERDVPSERPEMRAGVPQAPHIHAVLTKGRYLLDEFFPGIVDEVIAAGAIMIDHINDRRRLASYGWQPRFPTDLRMLLISRPLLEFHIRKRVAAIANIEFVGGTLALGLQEAAGTITGVIAAPVKDRENEKRIDADLVIDASGRSSNTPEWLEDLGFGKVEELLVDAKWGYSSRFFEKPSDWPYDWQLINMWPQIRRGDAQKTRGGVLCPQDGGRCIITLVGNAGDYPPRDEAGFLAFAESLISPEIADFIKRAKPAGPISVSRTTVNKWRRYDRLDKKPENFIVIGDAVAAFNPVYGQGMSLAALETRVLEDALNAWVAGNGSNLTGFAPLVQTKMIDTATFPWGASTGADSLVEGCEGGAAPNPAARAYGERASALGAIDKQFVLKFEEMANLVRDNKWMMEPDVRQLVIENWDRLGELSGAPACAPPGV